MASRVRWEGPFFTHHSMAVVNRELSLALLSRGAMGLRIRPTEAVQDPAVRSGRMERLIPAVDADDHADVVVRHGWPFVYTPPCRGQWVVMQPWEYGAMPRAWYRSLRFEADSVWVYSSFNREIYAEAGVPEDRITVVPLAVAPTMLAPAGNFPLRTRKRFRFLFVGGTLMRKGIDLLIDAYRRAFSDTDDVCLVVKDFGAESFYRNQGYGSRIRAVQKTPGAPEIEYITADLSEEQLRDLYCACDCLVHPYRGEGFGLPILEAMACGLPVIVPDQGGASDFAHEGTAITVPSRRVPVPGSMAQTLDVRGTPWWVEVDRAALEERMREIVRDPDSVRSIAQRGSAYVRANFTWDGAARRVESALGSLLGENTGPRWCDRRAQAEQRVQAGVERWEKRSWAEALRLFGEAREIEETNDALFNLAVVLRARGDDASALRVLERLQARLSAGGEVQELETDVRCAIEELRSRARQPIVPHGESIQLRWMAPIFNLSGYASESRTYLRGVLGDDRFLVHLVPHEGVPADMGVAEASFYQQLVARVNSRASRVDVDFQHGPASAFRHPAAPLSICRTMFETDRIPAEWAEACNRFSEVWVPSEFNRGTFARSGVIAEKIRIVPGAIDAAAYNPDRFPGERIRGGRGFTFLSIFDFTPRKGWDLLLRAFCEEFSAAEDVSLVIKVVNFFKEGSPQARVRRFLEESGFRNPPHLILVDQEFGEEELMRMYAGADAFVLASRGEGWGRPYMEAMSFRKPVIGTRWSANLEFMNDENSFLVEIDGLEPCERTWATMPLYEGHQWASPSVASLRAQMRCVFDDRREAARRAERAREDVVRKYDVPVVAAEFCAALRDLVG